MPSRRHRSLTVTSRRKPSSTIRIFSSGVYLRRVAALTVRTKDLAASVRSSAAFFLFGTSLAPLSEVLYLIQGADLTSHLSGFSTPSVVPLSLTAYSPKRRRHPAKPPDVPPALPTTSGGQVHRPPTQSHICSDRRTVPLGLRAANGDGAMLHITALWNWSLRSLGGDPMGSSHRTTMPIFSRTGSPCMVQSG